MNGKTPVSALQELMAARNLPLPTYSEEGGDGINFKCTVYANGVSASGFSPTKKGAKHECAKNALLKLDQKFSHLYASPSSIIFSPSKLHTKNYVGELNEYAQKNSVKAAEYEVEAVSSSGVFYQKCKFMDKSVIGTGKQKKDAKQDAAMKMLELVNTLPSPISKYRVLTPNISTTVEDGTKIINIFKKLSMDFSPKPEFNTYQPNSNIQICIDDTVEVLQEKMNQYGIEYSLIEVQQNPYIMHLNVKGTALHFLGCDQNRNEATRQVFQDVLEVKKCGCSLDTNDLISFP